MKLGIYIVNKCTVKFIFADNKYGEFGVEMQNNADARVLLRIYMMERILERVANSRYADDFIIKGGNASNIAGNQGN